MLLDLSNKRILITGASSGIGEQCTNVIRKLDASVYISGRSDERIRAVAARNKINLAQTFVGDLTEEATLDLLVNELPPLDGLVLSAGKIDYTPTKLISKKRLENVFEVNFYAIALLIQKLVKKKKLNRKGSIVLISSISSKTSVPGTAIYAASKAALNAYGKVLASEFGHLGIRVNMILPGIVRTKLIESSDSLSLDNINNAEKEYPLGYGNPNDVANQVVYLLSDASSWVTGTEVIIDGGYLINQ